MNGTRVFSEFSSDPPEDVDQTINSIAQLKADARYLGREPRQGYSSTYALELGDLFDVWYEPSIKENAEIRLGLLEQTGDYGISDYVRRVTGQSLAADPNIAMIGLTPARPYYGEPFLLAGHTAASTAVTAEVVANGSKAEGTSDSSGNFTLPLLAPGGNDNSPSSDDDGSFGIKVQAGALGYKIFTVELIRPNAADPVWVLY